LHQYPRIFEEAILKSTLAWISVLVLFFESFNAFESNQVVADEHRFEIQVIDSQTRRGVPMVSLTTVDEVVYITDSAGRVALDDSALMGTPVFFKVQSPGYSIAKDGLGMDGVRVNVESGKSRTIEISRTNIAERLYRITGRDIYRDSIQLGHSSPIKNPLGSGKVVGQDTVQPVRYQNKLWWFWGDTNRMAYPLGLFRTAGAVSEPPDRGGLDPSVGIDFHYFLKDDGFVRAMVDVPNPEGVVWIHGTCTVPDQQGREHIVAHYSRRAGLADPYEQGIVLWNDDRAMFEVHEVIDLKENWRILQGHPVRVTVSGIDYLYFGNPFLVSRVPAKLEALTDKSAYESFTCREELESDPPTEKQLSDAKPKRDSHGSLVWSWQKAPPVTQRDEDRWLKQGLITLDEASYLPRDASAPGRAVQMHAGTVQWNAFRRNWILIANELGTEPQSPSFLGEVFYSESATLTGPFLRAIRIATHPGQSFYNPCHHPFFDQNGGRMIYFEGTYCNTFTSSPATPRYNYNQMMYRLNLEDPRLVQPPKP
jgi:hypothetical protein